MLSFLVAAGVLLAQAEPRTQAASTHASNFDTKAAQPRQEDSHEIPPASVPAEPVPDEHGIYTPGAAIRSPVLLKTAELEYPEQAKMAGVRGEILLALVVDAKGVPQDVRVTRGPGSGINEAAISCVQLYRFKPALLHGKPVPVRLTLVLNVGWF